ncbi:MAG: FG-GAP-like repeat-containing protein [Bacteroidota bacterium]
MNPQQNPRGVRITVSGRILARACVVAYLLFALYSALGAQCTSGSLLLERWNGIGGSQISSLTGNGNYPNNPSETEQITSFQSANNGDSYGTRVRGYIEPSVTGNYRFSLTADDNTEFYLSTDQSEANASLVVSVPGWTSPTDFNKFSEQNSGNISLTAGQRYYVELLHKEGGGGDHFQVYWRTPVNNSRQIIPSSNLVSYPCGPVAVTLSFTESADSYNIDFDEDKDGGHAFADYDNDGDLDLLINTDEDDEGSRLYRNNGNQTFTDVTSSRAPFLDNNVRERSAVWGDLNNDGLLDFARNTSHNGNNSGRSSIQIFFQDPISGVFGNGSGGNRPFQVGDRNNSQLDIGDHNTEAVVFLDFDGDGDLDVAFDNHNYGVDILRNNYINHLTGNVVNPPFDNMFSFATPGNGVVLGLDQNAVDGDYGSATDVNDDGWVDLFIRKRDQNDFFLNEGGTFRIGSDIGNANNNNKGGVALYDYDNDGDFDAFWTENDDNEIHRNDGNGNWTALGTSTGIPTDFSTRIDEVASGDIDNDGDVDILLVGNNRSYLYINQLNDPALGPNVGSPMTFVLNNSLRFNNGEDGESTSMIDIDDDGDLDVYMMINGDDNQLWINNLYSSSTPESDKDYLFVSVYDNRSEYMNPGAERPALGAIVALEDCDGNVISGLREVNGGTGHGTQDPNRVHFGLPQGPDFTYRIIVRYPNYINSSGDTIRTTISKTIVPSEQTSFPILVNFRPDDSDIVCDKDCDNSGPDLDGDSIADLCDLDDDNDGIPDTVEDAVVLPGVDQDCGADPDYDFSNGPTLISGTNLAQGSVYRYTNVATGLDALVTVEELNGVTLPTLDDNSADANWFKPQSAFSIATSGMRAYAQYLITFVNSGTSTPVIQDAINLAFNDIDGNASYAEESAALNPTSYTVNNPTELTVVLDPTDRWVTGTSGTNEYGGVTNNFPQVNYSFRYRNVSQIRIRFGAQSRVDNTSAGGRQHALQFGCPDPLPNPVTYAFDLDQDGINNKDDLDSDNDGIWDATEAGHGRALTSIGRINGSDTGSGANGLFDPIETSPDSDVINYTLSDSETSSDGIYDPYELDSDGDGCFDTFEASVTDPENDGTAGVGVPVVDPNGLVTTWTYVVPSQTYWQDPLFDFCAICKTATVNPHVMYYRKGN